MAYIQSIVCDNSDGPTPWSTFVLTVMWIPSVSGLCLTLPVSLLSTEPANPCIYTRQPFIRSSQGQCKQFTKAVKIMGQSALSSRRGSACTMMQHHTTVPCQSHLPYSTAQNHALNSLGAPIPLSVTKKLCKLFGVTVGTDIPY